MTDVTDAELASFERAFDEHGAGCVRLCACGKTYFDDSPDGHWDWLDGELEQLRDWQKKGQAVGLGHAPGYVQFEGRQYVTDCSCWQERAKQLIRFIRGHAEGIAEFLTKEKARKVAEAAAMPTVK